MRAMRRPRGRVFAIVLLLALGVALGSVALEPRFDPPNHYDGDDDDAGLIGKTLSHKTDVGIIDTGLRFVPSESGRWLVPTSVSRQPQIVRGRFGSRAPPPDRASLIAPS
jgi:hypothetical protein